MSDNRTTRRKLSKRAIVRDALEQCSAPFVIKPASSNAIDWEGMARELYRRMTIAGEALQHVR